MSSRAPRSGPLREVRSCYDHVAGRLGVAIARAAIDRDWVVEGDGEWRVAADAGERILETLGLDVGLLAQPGRSAAQPGRSAAQPGRSAAQPERSAARSRRPDVRACLDWTERVPHLAGRLGAALLTAMLDAGWLERVPGSRALAVTPLGGTGLARAGILGIAVDESGCDADNLCVAGGVTVTVAAAEDWGALVERATREGWTGIAALAGFTGSIARAVERNAAGYGQQVADVIWSVRTRDRDAGAQRTFAMAECEFRPGGSRFVPVHGERRFDVIEATFLFRSGTITAPLADADLARLIGVVPGSRVPLPRVREAVLAASTRPR